MNELGKSLVATLALLSPSITNQALAEELTVPQEQIILDWTERCVGTLVRPLLQKGVQLQETSYSFRLSQMTVGLTLNEIEALRRDRNTLLSQCETLKLARHEHLDGDVCCMHYTKSSV